MAYFVSKTTVFFDGHGSPDEVDAIEKFISNDKVYGLLKPKNYYYPFEIESLEAYDGEDIEEVIEDECVISKDNQQCEDGYNLEGAKFVVREISAKEEVNFKEIINKYNKLR